MSKTPIIILHIEENNTFLQICVGAFEGNALELGLNNNQLLRPLPYDTFISIINKLGGRVEAVVIRKVINNIFYSDIIMSRSDGTKFRIDSRSSDALNIAIRTRVPIYVEDEVLENMRVSISFGEFCDKNKQKLNKNIDKDIKDSKTEQILKPSDFF